jgi:hypothetical protein
MSVREYFACAENIHVIMNLFPTDGGLDPVLVEDKCVDIYEHHLPKRWQDNLYSLGYDHLGSAVIDLIEQAKKQEMINALKITNEPEDSNPSPKKKSFPSTKNSKFSKKTVCTTDK